MEIERFMSAYKKHSPRQFFELIARDRVMELRFLKDYKGFKFSNWDLIATISEEYGIPKRFNSLYVKDYDEMMKVLKYKLRGVSVSRLYNIFLSVNPKRKLIMKSKNGLLYKSYQGSLAGTSHIQNIFCDIEHKSREGSATEAMIQECIDGAMYLVKILELGTYAINISGNGAHLWIPLEEEIELPMPNHVELEDKIKYNNKDSEFYPYVKMYNRYIEKLDSILQKFNPKLKVDDGAKDLSRVGRPVGSWNVKVGKTPRIVGTAVFCNQIINNIKPKILAVKPILNKQAKKQLSIAVKTARHRYNYLNIRECPLYKLMVNGLLPSILSRNHYLESSFARIIRDNSIDINQIQDVINEMSAVQLKDLQVDPDYLDDEEIFNSETVNNFCVTSKIDLVYPILEGVPEVRDGHISLEHYENLNSYSGQTIILNATTIERPSSYFELKKTIRDLVDRLDRTTVFFTIKQAYLSDWEYYDKNKVILQILNKTRRRLNK